MHRLNVGQALPIVGIFCRHLSGARAESMPGSGLPSHYDSWFSTVGLRQAKDIGLCGLRTELPMNGMRHHRRTDTLVYNFALRKFPRFSPRSANVRHYEAA